MYNIFAYVSKCKILKILFVINALNMQSNCKSFLKIILDLSFYIHVLQIFGFEIKFVYSIILASVSFDISELKYTLYYKM